ncbi:MAG TPA: RNA polymerase sigma factor [Fimbriimonadaceae bacterium]|nr:RNA polymerase sigma factor [Fimbriimonadaceae bacterium]
MNDAARAQFESLYAEHAGRVYRFALRLVGEREAAEDLAAESLAEAFRQWEGYRREAAPETWLCAIVLNRWKMRRRKREIPNHSLQEAEAVADTFRFTDLDLARAIGALTPELRAAFLLVKGEGFTHAEAARAAKVPVGTMYFRVHAAVRRLREALAPGMACANPTIEVTCETEN